MNTTSRKPGIGVEREHDAGRAQVAAHHVLHADRQRDRVVIELVVHAVGDRAVVEQRGVHFVHAGRAGAASPRTLRKVSCWPAKEASGRSSAVAEERTATANPRRWPILRQTSSTSCCEPRRERRREHPAADLLADDGEAFHVVHVERREQRRGCARRGRPARGSRGRPARWWRSRPARRRRGRRGAEIISPMEAFLPPTSSTSLFFSCSNGMM